MAPNLLNEDYFPLSKTPDHAPRVREGRRLHVSTPWRWAMQGVRGVRLETAMVGGVRITSKQALLRFFAALNTETASDEAIDEAHHQAIEKELDKRGIKAK